MRDRLLEVIPQERHAEQVAGRVPVVCARGFLAQLVPILGRVVLASEPGERHEIDLLVLVERIDEARELVEHGKIGRAHV